MRTAVLLASLAICLSSPGYCLTYYVSPSGTDTNTGLSWAEAFLTLQHAADQVIAGDTVLVADGNYTGFDLRTSGTPVAPIVLLADGSSVVIDLQNPYTPDGINIENADWIVVEGFRVVNQPRNGIRVVLSHHCTVRNSRCDNNFERGIFTGFTDHLLLEYNTCLNSIDEHGIYISNSSDSVVVRYNTCAFNNASGIQINADLSAGGDGISEGCEIYGNILYENGSGGGAAINLDGAVGTRIYNNLIYENHATGIALFQIDGAVPSTDATITHNTILQAVDGRWCILVVDGSTGASIHNNILINQHPWRGSIAVDAISESGFASDYNILVNSLSNMGDGVSITFEEWQDLGYDLHSQLADPLDSLFEDHPNNDFHLVENAQAIDAGSAALADGVDHDLDFVLRPQGLEHDPGAYEYDGVILALEDKGTPDQEEAGKSCCLVWSHQGRIHIFSGMKGAEVRLFGLDGREVLRRELSEGSNVVDAGYLKPLQIVAAIVEINGTRVWEGKLFLGK